MTEQERRFVVRMRNVRKSRGLTQDDVARAAGIPRTVIVKIENEKRDGLRVAEVFAISKALGVTAEEMLSEAPMTLRVEIPVD